MKKSLLKSLGIVLCLLSFNSKAQTYSQWGHAVNETNHMYDSITVAYDTLTFEFTNTSPTAYADARLVVYYEGNFGMWTWMDLFDEQINYFGGINTGNRPACAPGEDSTVHTLNMFDINTWAADGSIFIKALPGQNAGGCAFSRVRMKLVYNYCVNGPPAEFATPSLPSLAFCSSDAPVSLSGTPAGGTFSGPGVTGSLFNPANLAAGSYQINYTAIDNLACETTGSTYITIKGRPIINNSAPLYACNGSTVALNITNGTNNPRWFSNAALSNSLSSASTYITPILTQNTNYWISSIDNKYTLENIAVTPDNFNTVDVDPDAGDDHGGMAVTPNYVYLNGDNNCVRYDLDFTPASLTILPIRDGMFSDLHTGALWSLFDTVSTTAPFNNMSNDYTINAIRGMDDDLNFTNNYIYLSTPIVMSPYDNGIFAGSGEVGLYSASTGHWYVIDLDNGNVNDLGYIANSELMYSETWSSWGVLESTCNGSYAVIYKTYNYVDADIHRRELPDGAVTSVGAFSDLSDMASFTFSPWNNRWYWHYEGSGDLGGTSETLGYADATGNEGVCPGTGLGCATKATVNVPVNVTLNVPLAAVCLDNTALALTGGSPAGGAYSGIGVGTNSVGTVFYPSLSGVGPQTVSYTRTDAPSGCVDVATQVINVNALPVVTAATNHTNVCLNTGASVTLTAAGAGAGGSYEWSSGLGSNSEVSFYPTADQTYMVTGTDANGCKGTSAVQVLVSPCTGISTIGADNNSLSVYPNPNNGEFTISSNQDITLTIVNELGQLVNVVVLNSSTPEVKVSNLSNGIYFITGSNVNGSVKQKIVVAK